MRQASFSPERAVEALIYLARRLQAPTLHEVLKLRYFADKLHLSRYGFFASGDNYSAMQFGPVGSATYDLLKAAGGRVNQFTPPTFITAVQGALVVNGAAVSPLREERLERLSAAELECLDSALEAYGNLPFEERTTISHDDAYEKAWAAAQVASAFSGDIGIDDVAETLENSEVVLSYIRA